MYDRHSYFDVLNYAAEILNSQNRHKYKNSLHLNDGFFLDMQTTENDHSKVFHQTGRN